MTSSGQTTDSWLLRVERQVARAASTGTEGKIGPAGEALDRATVRRLFDEVSRLARGDRHRAAEVAELATRVAELLDDDVSRGLALKATGFLRYLATEYEAARADFERAAAYFEGEGDELEYAATLNTALHTLSYLGRYEEAYAAAARAREIFEAHAERLRLARLDTNEGNILFRHERIDEAQQRYRSALERLRELNAPPQDVAAALHNIITCAIALHDFEGALAAHDELRRHCDTHGMAPVAAQAEYNIAYLYFLRGEYDRALDLYREARALAGEVGDGYHQALCDLDQAEILLELNMRQEGSRMAGEALTAFEELGLGYEAGKAISFLAIAANQEGKAVESLALFQKARDQFEREGNEAWTAIIDLDRAVIYHDERRGLEARKLARSALRFFERSSLISKTVMCELLLARVEIQFGNPAEAGRLADSALRRVEGLDRPSLDFRARLVAAQVEEEKHDRLGARQRLEEAAELLENLRSHLRGEELKLAFLRDKNEVYESLVWLIMAGPASASDKRSVFVQMERAKSRTLADLVSFRAPMMPAAARGHSRLVDQMLRLRTELNWYYRQIDLEEIRSAAARAGEAPGVKTAKVAEPAGPGGPVRLTDLYDKSRRREQELIATLSDLRSADAEFGSLQTASVADLDAIRSALPEKAMLLEYFEARDVVFCACLGPSTLEVVPLTTGTLVRELQRKLAFQLSKFRLGRNYTKKFAPTLLASTRSHLGALHRELIEPLRPHLAAEHLVVVPHGSMHYLPFHAFRAGDRDLIDDFSISYAPSATVYSLCMAKEPSRQTGSLVLGVSSEETPGIVHEVQAVADVLPEATLLRDGEATEERLRRDGAKARRLHIATHGLFREDNPMFSALQLGDSRLTLFDLYSLQLDADLVVLSGCGTGLNVVEGGDELIGLSRGLLYAGARSVVASLWDVHDKSAVRFMTAFHRACLDHGQPARALREAMHAVRKAHPHPYYWAPFVLVGQSAPKA